MVLKHSVAQGISRTQFENDVNMYGTQASDVCWLPAGWFENDVNMYGTQAKNSSFPVFGLFENDVNMYGTQANQRMKIFAVSLRMM